MDALWLTLKKSGERGKWGDTSLDAKHAVKELIFGGDSLMEPGEHVSHVAERIMGVHFNGSRRASRPAHSESGVEAAQEQLGTRVHDFVKAVAEEWGECSKSDREVGRDLRRTGCFSWRVDTAAMRWGFISSGSSCKVANSSLTHRYRRS